ncbi:hypothetical protein ACWD04_31470 [Streptomyces sp. NPDC002911]
MAQRSTGSAPPKRRSPSTLNLTLVLFVGLLLLLVSGDVLAGPAYVTHRHPRLEKPLNVAGVFAGALVATFAALVAIAALTT